MRDKLKSKEYFDLFISRRYESIERMEKKLPEIDKSKIKIIENIKYGNFKNSIEILLAKYSRGDDLELIKEEYINFISRFKEILSDETSDTELNFISLGILLNINLDEDEEILSFVNADKPLKGLIDILVTKKINRDIRLYKDIQKFRPWIIELFENPLENEEIIKKQLSNWYRSEKGSYFYGTHKRPDEDYLYFGYWAFEIAALVKILNIPDDIFKNNKYYPYDLVHFGG